MTDSILTSDFLSVSSLLFCPVTSVDSGEVPSKRPRVTLELLYRTLYYGVIQYKEHQGFTLWSLHVLQVFTDFSSTTNLSVGVTVRLDVFYVALAMCPGVWPPTTSQDSWITTLITVTELSKKKKKLTEMHPSGLPNWKKTFLCKVAPEATLCNVVPEAKTFILCQHRKTNVFPSGFLTRQQRLTCDDKISDYCQDEFPWEVPQVPTTSAPFTTTLNGSQRSTYEKAPARHIQVRLISVNTT